jgi:hypothetical protein
MFMRVNSNCAPRCAHHRARLRGLGAQTVHPIINRDRRTGCDFHSHRSATVGVVIDARRAGK